MLRKVPSTDKEDAENRKNKDIKKLLNDSKTFPKTYPKDYLRNEATILSSTSKKETPQKKGLYRMLLR